MEHAIHNILSILVILFYAISGSYIRRWFGGGYGKAGKITRFWKYLAIVFVVYTMYQLKVQHFWTDWEFYWTEVWFCIFWSIGHGTWFCYWDHSSSAEGRLPMIDKLIWACIGVHESRTFLGNCFGMFVRYELTSIPIAISTSLWFLLAGPIVALCYIPAGLKKNTNIGEHFGGALVFILLYLCICASH